MEREQGRLSAKYFANEVTDATVKRFAHHTRLHIYSAQGGQRACDIAAPRSMRASPTWDAGLNRERRGPQAVAGAAGKVVSQDEGVAAGGLDQPTMRVCHGRKGRGAAEGEQQGADGGAAAGCHHVCMRRECKRPAGEQQLISSVMMSLDELTTAGGVVKALFLSTAEYYGRLCAAVLALMWWGKVWDCRGFDRQSERTPATGGQLRGGLCIGNGEASSCSPVAVWTALVYVWICTCMCVCRWHAPFCSRPSSFSAVLLGRRKVRQACEAVRYPLRAGMYM